MTCEKELPLNCTRLMEKFSSENQKFIFFAKNEKYLQNYYYLL